MIKHKLGNILDAEENYICHQVNCRGVMGAGLALQIKNKYPKVHADYIGRIQNDLMGRPLGEITATQVGEKQVIINMFAQDGHGRIQRYTDYEAFYKCLEKIKKITKPTSTIAFPYYIGCGLGGGNWHIIETMIKEVLYDREVVFYHI